MRYGHLLVRCGPHRILVPGDNIATIEEVSDLAPAAISTRLARRNGWQLVLDARVLLGLDPAASAPPRVNIHWHSRDGARRAVLGVDAVDGLRHGDEADVLTLPRVPRRFRGLFDGLVPDDGGGFLFRLRGDVSQALDSPVRRRRFLRAVMGAAPLPLHVPNELES
jgi:hypothetical protein